MVRFKRVMCGSGARQDAGYTLMEVIVALAVISAAAFIVIGGFTRSNLLADRSVSSSIAAAFAEEKLAELQQTPSAFSWPDDTKLADAAFARFSTRSFRAKSSCGCLSPIRLSMK
ncbi:MAG: prepilin-type N-terminal cleavage/methylation domain-containing protein [Candidatus Hydrogenedentales bacterium]